MDTLTKRNMSCEINTRKQTSGQEFIPGIKRDRINSHRRHCNPKCSKYMEQKLKELTGKIDKSTIVVENIKTLLNN